MFWRTFGREFIVCVNWRKKHGIWKLKFHFGCQWKNKILRLQAVTHCSQDPVPHLYLVSALHLDDDVVCDPQGVEGAGHPHWEGQAPRLRLWPADHEASERLICQNSHGNVPVHYRIVILASNDVIYSFIHFDWLFALLGALMKIIKMLDKDWSVVVVESLRWILIQR